MKWFKEHKKAASIGLAGIFLLVLILIGCGVAFSGSGNGSDQKEQEASVTDEKSSDTEVKKEDTAKEEVSEEKIETKEEAKKEEKTEKKDEAKTSSNKSSSNSSTKKTETKSNGSSSSSSKPQHTHTWVAQTKSVYHEATGHYENKWVQDSAAWDEDQYTEKVVCGCGAVFDNDNQWEHHSLNTDCIYGYSVLPVKTGTIHHEATGHNEQKWVQDSAAWTETVTTGYKCSGCGATK